MFSGEITINAEAREAIQKLLSIPDHTHKTIPTTRTMKPLEYEVPRHDFLQDESS